MMEILFCRSNADIKLLNACWLDRFKYPLEEEIMKQIGNNNFNLLFQGCLMAARDESVGSAAVVNTASGDTLVNAIINQGFEAIWTSGINSSDCRLLIETLSKASDAQLKYIYDQYREKKSADLIDAINSSFSNKQLARAVSSKFMSRPENLCRAINKSLDALVTDKTTVVRIVGRISKEEVSVLSETYKRLYQLELMTALSYGLSLNPNLVKAIRCFVFEVLLVYAPTAMIYMFVCLGASGTGGGIGSHECNQRICKQQCYSSIQCCWCCVIE